MSKTKKKKTRTIRFKNGAKIVMSTSKNTQGYKSASNVDWSKWNQQQEKLRDVLK